MSIRKRKAMLTQRSHHKLFRRPPWAIDRSLKMLTTLLTTYVGEGVLRLAVTNRTATDEELKEASK